MAKPVYTNQTLDYKVKTSKIVKRQIPLDNPDTINLLTPSSFVLSTEINPTSKQNSITEMEMYKKSNGSVYSSALVINEAEI